MKGSTGREPRKKLDQQTKEKVKDVSGRLVESSPDEVVHGSLLRMYEWFE